MGFDARNTYSDVPESIVIPIEEPVNPPDARELAMINAILQMEDGAVKDVMVPRPDLVAVGIADTVGRAAEIMVLKGHSRILVYQDTLDKIVGIVHARDILRTIDRIGNTVGIAELMRAPYFVPETKRLDELMWELQRERVHMAVIVDEYGDTAGIVTFEDLLEEIVGEIVDEFDRSEPEVQVINENLVVLDARVNLGILKDHFAIEIEGEGFDTVGGLIYSSLGKMPGAGDVVFVDGLKLQVLNTIGRRIKKIRVIRIPKDTEQNNPSASE